MFKNLCTRYLTTKTYQIDTSNIFHRYRRVMDVPNGLFKGVVDRFNGITIDSEAECGTNNFPDKLEKSLDYWIANKRRAIWFKVHTLNSNWVPDLVQNGFDFHHARKGYVMLYKWLPQGETENIPDFAHTLVGVGGVVVNERNEVLVVSEKYAIIPNSWKLPGGYVERNENIIDAAIREVKEETGVDSQFETIISFRHSHGGGFNCSDMYIVVGLSPKSTEIVKCDREIAKLCWMPISEYLNHPNVHETNRNFVQAYLDYKQNGFKINCATKTHQVLKKSYNVYTAELNKL